MFRDRKEAGLILAEKLKKYIKEDGIVLAVPRGGVPVAYEVAKELNFPMEVILTKKIGHPMNKEYAIGAASLVDYFIIPHENVSDEYIKGELEKVRQRLKEMYQLFMGDKEPARLEGKTVILVDDGIATGNTLLGTVKLLRKSKPKKIVIAVPVAPETAIEKLSPEADEVMAVLVPYDFYGVGGFYDDFTQVSDQEVIHFLNQSNRLPKTV